MGLAPVRVVYDRLSTSVEEALGPFREGANTEIPRILHRGSRCSACSCWKLSPGIRAFFVGFGGWYSEDSGFSRPCFGVRLVSQSGCCGSDVLSHRVV